MRRILLILVLLLVGLFGLPATAAAEPNPIGGGSVLYNPIGNANDRCIVAFAATDGRTDYLVAARGCTTGTSTKLYSGNNVLVGPVVSERNGYLLVAVTNTAAWDVVGWIVNDGKRYPVRGSTETVVGGMVCLLNGTTGIECGRVLAKNVTVTFPWGTVFGVTRTDICARPHSVVYLSGDQVQGVPLGGDQFCTTAGNSYFYPANRVLSGHGLKLLTG